MVKSLKPRIADDNAKYTRITIINNKIHRYEVVTSELKYNMVQ